MDLVVDRRSTIQHGPAPERTDIVACGGGAWMWQLVACLAGGVRLQCDCCWLHRRRPRCDRFGGEAAAAAVVVVADSNPWHSCSRQNRQCERIEVLFAGSSQPPIGSRESPRRQSLFVAIDTKPCPTEHDPPRKNQTIGGGADQDVVVMVVDVLTLAL